MADNTPRDGGEGVIWGQVDEQPDHGPNQIKSISDLQVGETVLWCHFELDPTLVTIEELDVDISGRKGFNYSIPCMTAPARACEYYYAMGLEAWDGKWLLNNWFERISTED